MTCVYLFNYDDNKKIFVSSKTVDYGNSSFFPSSKRKVRRLNYLFIINYKYISWTNLLLFTNNNESLIDL
jgi:hypothetical protein